MMTIVNLTLKSDPTETFMETVDPTCVYGQTDIINNYCEGKY